MRPETNTISYEMGTRGMELTGATFMLSVGTTRNDVVLKPSCLSDFQLPGESRLEATQKRD
jgi:hypothetical protein